MTLVLDNEAVQALSDVRHAKHRAVIARLLALSVLHERAARAEVVTTTAVRVEAGVTRSAPAAAALGRFQVRDVALDTARADRCVELSAAGGSVVDATVAQAAEEHAEAGRLVTVLTADLTDLDRLVAHTRRAGAVRVRRV